MSKSVADTEPFPFRQELQETIFEAIKGWQIRLPDGLSTLRGATGAHADVIADAIREVYVDGLRNSGSAGQHYLAMRGEVVQAHNELDRVSIERSEDGAIHSLPHRVAILAGRYVDNQRRLAQLGAERATEEAPDGWQGQLPAEGTRRRLIFEAVMGHRVFRTVGSPSGEKTALELADLIEDALIEAGRDETTFVAGQRWGKTEAMREKIREDAATPEDAEAAIRELESTGRAFMNGAGQHVGTQGGEPSDDRPPTDDAGEPEDGPFSGSLEIGIGPDGYPWINVLGLIELFEKLGMAAYRDEEVAEPGPEEADLEGEIDPDVPLWRVEVSRAFDHLLNAARVGFRV